MSTTMPLLAARWFRVSALRPRLVTAASVHRISYRRQPWYVIEHRESRRSFRVNAAAYAFVGRCTGTRTMQALWDMLLAEQQDDAPTQDELLHLLTQLHAASLLEFDRPADFGRAGLAPAADAAPRKKNSLFALRLPLGNPEALLDRLPRRLPALFGSGVALALWSALVLLALLSAALNADSLFAHARLWAGTPRMLLLGVVVYPLVKALHELGHALALRRFGARVPEWGITLLMFTPVPYVDGSAASSLPSASQRFVVSMAGIGVELALASLGLLLALNLQPGALRDLGFTLFLIGAVSTLLVNGNPLMRFDGYHALCDALQLPNLASRSTRWWADRLRARLLRAPAVQPLVAAPGEAGWLRVYAPASLLYRLVASVALVAWLGQISAWLGFGIALLLAWLMLLKPAFALWRWLRGTALDEDLRRPASRRAAAIALMGLGAATLLPLPYASVVQGVVWLPDEALVRAQTDGFIETVDVRDGQAVAAGDLLFSLASPSLAAERAALQSRLDALDVEHFQALGGDAERAANLQRELDAAQAALDRLDERLGQLSVRAGTAGRVVVTQAADLPGHFVQRGALLAHVLTQAPTLVRAAIPQEQAALIQQQSRAVSVSLAEADGRAWPAAVPTQLASTVAALPSAALGDRSGGPVVTDPLDKAGLKPAEGIVLADLRLAQAVSERVGGRAWVRFDHGLSPLAMQVLRRLQQWVLAHFNPTS